MSKLTTQTAAKAHSPATPAKARLPAKAHLNVRLEVALALPEEQHIAKVSVPLGTNILRAIELSNIFELFDREVPAELHRLEYGVGISGKEIKQPAEHIPQNGERIEIYRPLLIDPKQARLNRIRKK